MSRRLHRTGGALALQSLALMAADLHGIRQRDVVLGGCAQHGDVDAAPREADTLAIRAGLARRVPDLALPEEWKIHRCEFCVFAKTGATLRGCLNNKHAVNRVLIRRGAGFVGQCHLGLTDMVEPLVVRSRIVASSSRVE